MGKIHAVVGASKNKEKYGYKVYKNLLDRMFDVIPINPNEEEILDNKVYHTLKDFPGNIDLVIFVVPPAITLQVLEEVKELGIKEVWFQPGSESPEAIVFCQKNMIKYTEKSCIMINA
jgi:predicted CoA-binding protein